MPVAFSSLTKQEQEATINCFYDLFAGRLDTYAIRFEFSEAMGGTIYQPSNKDNKSVQKAVSIIGSPEFGTEAVRAHLEGTYLLGVYPIDPDSNVRWFAMDFDGGDGTDPFTEALRQATTLYKEGGLQVYIERSQSGNGYHVWGFLDGKINAGKLRHALRPMIEKGDTYDRMFPNQDGLTDLKPLGNLIALPLAGRRLKDGNSAFLKRGADGTPEPYDDQFEFIGSNIKLNSVEKIEELFALAGTYTPEDQGKARTEANEGLSKGWKITHETYGCEWVRWCYDNPEQVTYDMWYALAANFAQLENGRELFHEWSQRDVARYSARATDAKYDEALRQNKPHSSETIRGFGGNCECDRRFPGKVRHPYDLAKLPFKSLVESVGADENDARIVTAGDVVKKVIVKLKQIEADPEAGQGRKYGIRSIDAYTRLRDSDLVIIAARPGMGKTAFSNSIVDAGCVAGEPNYYFSMEMAQEQLIQRQLSTRAGVSQTRMATGQLTRKDWDKIDEAARLLDDPKKYPLYIDDMTRSVERIYEIAADLVGTHGKGVIWIDYLQLAQRLPRESMFDAVTRIVTELKMLAKALKCPVVALTQLNRTADDATGESQTMDSWLRGSGDIEQAADVIVFLLGEKGPGVKQRIFALHKERHREGGIRINLDFNQPLMRFAEEGTYALTSEEVEGPRRRPREEQAEGEAPAEIPVVRGDHSSLEDL